MAPLGWTLIVEQPTREAYGNAAVLHVSFITISVALLAMISIGYFGTAIYPADSHIEARNRRWPLVLTRALDIDWGRVHDLVGVQYHGRQLIELTENLKRQERQAMFGASRQARRSCRIHSEHRQQHVLPRRHRPVA
jgi:hypothetical protein